MSTIHVVMRHEGSYDDYSVNMVKGFVSEEKANEHIAALQDKDARYNEVIFVLYDAFREWFKENPFPVMETLEQVPRLPKGTKSKDITPEHKRECARIQRENTNKQARRQAAQIVWDERAKQFCEGLLEQHVAEEDHGEFDAPFWNCSCHEYDYTVEQLEVEE